NIPELHYQIQRFHSFLRASGGAYSDFLIHNIDECCWMKNGWPINAKASGGRHYRNNYIDQNFDTYSVEYTFADGAKLFLEGRTHRAGHHSRSDAEPSARVRSECRPADDGFAGPAAARRWALPGAAAGHLDDPGVLRRPRKWESRLR